MLLRKSFLNKPIIVDQIPLPLERHVHNRVRIINNATVHMREVKRTMGTNSFQGKLDGYKRRGNARSKFSLLLQFKLQSSNSSKIPKKSNHIKNEGFRRSRPLRRCCLRWRRKPWSMWYGLIESLFLFFWGGGPNFY